MKSYTQLLIEKAIRETEHEIAVCYTSVMQKSSPNMPEYIESLNVKLIDYNKHLDMIKRIEEAGEIIKKIEDEQ